MKSPPLESACACHENASEKQQPLKRGEEGGSGAAAPSGQRPMSDRISALVLLTPWWLALAAAAAGPSVFVSASSTIFVG